MWFVRSNALAGTSYRRVLSSSVGNRYDSCCTFRREAKEAVTGQSSGSTISEGAQEEVDTAKQRKRSPTRAYRIERDRKIIDGVQGKKNYVISRLVDYSNKLRRWKDKARWHEFASTAGPWEHNEGYPVIVLCGI